MPSTPDPSRAAKTRKRFFGSSFKKQLVSSRLDFDPSHATVTISSSNHHRSATRLTANSNKSAAIER
jgi:hypothetical protein